MCLYTKRKYKTRQVAMQAKPLTAKKDIKVYKYLYQTKRGYRSPFRDYFYKPGVHYYQTGSIPFGIMSAFCKEKNKYEVVINTGLHAFTNIVTANRLKGYYAVVKEFIIPKGAKYYLGSRGDIVSDQLIFPYESKTK